MDTKLKQELTSNDGKKIELADYDIEIVMKESEKIRSYVRATFTKKLKDCYGDSSNFTDDEVETLIQDLKDLSDWRHYRKLKNKINSKDE